MKKSNSSKVDLAVEYSNLLGLRKSLQGVLLTLRSSIALMNNVFYSGRFKDIESTIYPSDSNELPF